MRLLFLAGRDPAHPQAGGGDVQAWAWATWAAKRGDRVTYVCQWSPGLDRYAELDGVRILRLGRGFKLTLAAFRYYRKHRREYDLLYEDPIGAGRSPYMAPIWARVPVVAVWHQVTAKLLFAMNPWPVAAALAVAERIVALAFRHCNLWVPSEERAREVVRSLGFLEKNVHVISPTLPYSDSAMPAIHVRKRQILFLGVWRRYKAIDHLIRAFASAVEQVGDAELVIAGRRMDVKYERELRTLTEQLHLEDHVTFMPNVSEVEKRRLLATTCALVLPSLLEGFGIVVLEANALGTPAIVSTGVPAAAVRSGETGLRYKYGDVRGLAAAIEAILTDEMLWAKLARASSAYAREFEITAVAPKFEAMLEEAVADRGTGSPVGESV